MNKYLISIIIINCIILMSIGYSALNTNLTISGEVSYTFEDNIKITNIEVSTQENEAYPTYNPTFTDTQTTLFVTMPKANSKITFNIEITNPTSSHYHISEINELSNSNQWSNITYFFENEEILFLKPNSVNNITVTFYYDGILGTSHNLSVNLEYNFTKVSYEKLDYINSTGTQYIDSGISNTGDYILESEFYPAISAEGEGFWLFSGRKITEYTLGLYFYIGTTYNYTINSYGGNTAPYTAITFPKDIWYSMYFSRNIFTINSIEIPVTTKQLIPESAESSILIGGNIVNWDGTVDTRNFEGKIKYFKITDLKTNSLIRYFIPVKLLTNEIGFLDLVENKFYKNIGTGNFLEP